MKLLHIDSSVLGANSVSRALTADIVAAQRAAQPGIEVTYRDLAADPLGHLSLAHLGALQGAVPADPAAQRDVAAGQAALAELQAADVIVLGAPMYNFTIPTQLKAWIDRVLIAGVTFRYTERGPEGLLVGKRAFVAVSRGGFYHSGSPAESLEHVETYLRGVLAFVGITEVTFVRADGIALGPEQREKALDGARGEVARLAA